MSDIDMVVHYSKEAIQNLQHLNKKDAKRIVRKIKENTSLSNPLIRAKALVGDFTGLYRYRIGNYRGIFTYDDYRNVVSINIITIKHRKDVYKK